MHRSLGEGVAEPGRSDAGKLSWGDYSAGSFDPFRVEGFLKAV